MVTGVGDGAFAAAVPLLAVALTRDPRLVSLVTVAATLPWLVLSLPAGALVDRYDRSTLMWRGQVTQAVLAALLAVTVAAGWTSITLLAGVAFALGACEVVVSNAAQAILPDLVPAAALHRANGQQFAATTTARTFVGPPVGSLLFATAAALPFGLDAISFAVAAVLVARLPRRPAPAAAVPMRRAIGEGLRWLGGHRLLRTLALLLGVNLFCFQLATVTLVLMVTEELRVGTGAYGLLLAAGAVGGITGGLAGHRVVARLGTVWTVVVALGGAVPAYLAAGAAPDAYTLGVLLALISLCSSMWNVVTVSLRQSVVPAGLLGRVNAVYRLLASGLTPLGALAGGVVAHEIGVRAAYPIAGVIRGGALLVALPVLLQLQRKPLRAGGDAGEDVRDGVDADARAGGDREVAVGEDERLGDVGAVVAPGRRRVAGEGEAG